ncbi:MAG: PEPxxWA-CTERM sorting domain-containing protein [Novosphingobium sp.]
MTKHFYTRAAIAGAVMAAGIGATEAQAATFSVFTGYADNLRASGFFPSPWIGNAGVVSQSSAAQSFDSGAVRILNSGGSAFTISNFTVTMNGGSGPTYSIWNPLTIGAGQNGIFTQTVSYNFDSSDNAFGSPPGGILPTAAGANGIGGCSSTAAAQAAASITALCAANQPIVSFLLDGNPFTLSDSGHILDTGLYDFVNYSPDGNESINWNLIGTGATRGGTPGVPEPSTWALSILGFGLVGGAMRRARQKARVSYSFA